jgi:predicted ATPase
VLTRLRVKNFRLLKDLTLECNPEVPLVLVGPNASGKSTILEVFDFLARCAQNGLAAAVEAHGGMDSMRSAGSGGTVDIETRWSFRTSLPGEAERRWELEWKISLGGTKKRLCDGCF